MTVVFYPGLHQPSDAHRFERACISINRLLTRKKPLGECEVIVDSGAFKELEKFGEYRASVEVYAARLRRLHNLGVARIVIAVSQDYMCEPFMLKRTGLTVADHQRLTIERYDALFEATGDLPIPIMPVLQGYEPEEYVAHLHAYGSRLTPGMWVGVGSVCKRNAHPSQVAAVLRAIHLVRPDLLLHGFGVKLTALKDSEVRDLLATADSMAGFYAARRQGRNSNSWLEAKAFADRVESVAALPRQPYQLQLFAA